MHGRTAGEPRGSSRLDLRGTTRDRTSLVTVFEREADCRWRPVGPHPGRKRALHPKLLAGTSFLAEGPVSQTARISADGEYGRVPEGLFPGGMPISAPHPNSAARGGAGPPRSWSEASLLGEHSDRALASRSEAFEQHCFSYPSPRAFPIRTASTGAERPATVMAIAP